MSPLSWRRPEVAIPAIYFTVASVWEVGSESAVSWFTGSSDFVERWEIVKDLLFVGLCGLSLAVAVRSVVRRLRDEGRRRIEAEHQLAEELQQLTARLSDAREAEQVRIGRDLHDDLGQLVTALTMAQRGLERQAGQLPATPARDDLVARAADTRALAGQVLASIRRITADLQPVALQQLGLTAALEREAEAMEGRTGVSCSVEADPGLEPLPDRTALALFRIGQEALTNVARHANASRVGLVLRSSGTVISLRVEDDGRGFEARTGPALGLLGMRERAAALGGEVTVRSVPGRGTAVVAILPLPSEGRGEAVA